MCFRPRVLRHKSIRGNISPGGVRASIRGSATLCVARWTQRRGRQLHGFQYCCKHRARLLTKKAFRCCRPVRPGEEKVVNGGEARPLAWQIESSQVMAAQG